MISADFSEDGYLIIPGTLSTPEIKVLTKEADRLKQNFGSVCVRNIRAKSEIFAKCTFQEFLPQGYHPVRSILFDKTPEENWPVPWHQDLTIAVRAKADIPGYGPWSVKDNTPHVQPPLPLLQEMITLRLHLDETPAKNGALRVIPGSHLVGRIPSDQISSHSVTSSVTCECHPGDILLMSPLILHASSRSQEPSHRRILHFEFAPTNSLHPNLTWHEKAT